MDESTFLIVLAAPRGRMRDSLLTLLAGASRIRVAGAADTLPGVLGLVSSSAVRFLLIDSDMRDEAAWTLLGYVKSARPDLRCLMLVNDFHEHTRARKLGADMVLLKGFRIEELFALFPRIFPLEHREPIAFHLPDFGRKEGV